MIGSLRAYLRSIDPRLPRSVWTMEAGGLVNAFGNGITYPFVVIYLHNVRGFSLGTAGLVLAANGAVSLLASPLAGWLSDRIGGRLTLAGALVFMAAGIASFPLVREPWHAFLAMAVVGAGNGSFWPSQSTLLAGLAPVARRHAAYALQRVSRNLGIGLGGLTGGLIATTSDPTSFTILFLIDAATFLGFIAVLPFVPDPELPPVEEGARPGRYRDVLRDRLLLGIVAVNVVFVSAGYAQIELLPVFAKNEAHVSERGIGVIFLVNTLVIVFAQLPIARALEGRRRMPALALMTVLWATAWMIVLVGGAMLEAIAAASVFALAGLVFGLGECFHGPTQGALVADLAPPRLRGRYMALSTISWEIGFVIGPAIGGFVLDRQPLALWPLAAAVCLLAGVGALALERGIPPGLRLTPA
ncbi:MAG TPA: MFS transporter [Gaiellaceae bacterium]|nr:MFS transporter [Gaiellaceae bacterium]